MDIIRIKDFKGLFTNGDIEDVPLGFHSVLSNTRPYNGALVKTYGWGIAVNTGTTNNASNLFTYMHPELNGGTLANEDWLYMYVYVNPATFATSFLGWYPAGPAWTAMGISLGSFYHKNGWNPILQHGNVLRILPGNVSKPDGTNEAYGFWMDKISRTFFDGQYSPTADFWKVLSIIQAPDSTFVGGITMEQIAGGSFEAEARYYKFSYVYDGSQESLLSSSRVITYTLNNVGKLTFTIAEGSHNRRITAIKVYRSDTQYGTYKRIHTIDLLRPASGRLRSATATDSSLGDYYIHVPALTTYNFDVAKDYQITLGGTIYEIAAGITGTGNITFAVRTVAAHGGGIAPLATTGKYDVAWSLHEWTGAAWSAALASGTDSAYAGEDVLIVSATYGTDNLIDRYLYFAETYWRLVTANKDRAVQFSGGTMGSVPQGTWAILRPDDGVYFCDDTGTDHVYQFFDDNYTELEEHPLAGEVSIKVNGQYAIIVGGRLFQGNLVLDPGNTGEERPGWISYSELDQPDVNPVSNVINIEDREGGLITGMADIFGNVVVTKERSIVTIGIRDNPDDPTKWYTQEAKHGIGCIAPKGLISVFGDLYVCAFDGIYRLRPNNLAASDTTPTEMLRISEPINNYYLALTEAHRRNCVSIFDQQTSEIIFGWSDGSIYAYNVITEDWRQITPSLILGLATADESGDALIWVDTTNKLYSPTVSQAIAIDARTKLFHLDDKRYRVVRYVSVTYKSTAALTLTLYKEGTTSAAGTATLAASTSRTTVRVPFRYRCKKCAVGISDTVVSTTPTEIYEVSIYVS